ncbi:MAG: HEPN family nuclease [Pyrinomonadaceae bacterium]
MDIPRGAYVEAQIIHKAANAGALEPFAREQERYYGVTEGYFGQGIFLQTRAIALLYTLILVPKEFWELQSDSEIYTRLEGLFSLDDVQITIDASRHSGELYKFIHHLRNALAHARFKFAAKSFEFWDRNPRTNVESYRAIVQEATLIAFLEVVGSNFASYGSWPDILKEAES